MQKTIWDIFQSLHFHFVVQMDLMASLYFSIFILHVVEQTKAFKYPHFFLVLGNSCMVVQSGIGFLRTIIWFCNPSLVVQNRKIWDKVGGSGSSDSWTDFSEWMTLGLGLNWWLKKRAPWQSLIMITKTSQETKIKVLNISKAMQNRNCKSNPKSGLYIANILQ